MYFNKTTSCIPQDLSIHTIIHALRGQERLNSVQDPIREHSSEFAKGVSLNSEVGERGALRGERHLAFLDEQIYAEDCQAMFETCMEWLCEHPRSTADICEMITSLRRFGDWRPLHNHTWINRVLSSLGVTRLKGEEPVWDFDPEGSTFETTEEMPDWDGYTEWFALEVMPILEAMEESREEEWRQAHEELRGCHRAKDLLDIEDRCWE